MPFHRWAGGKTPLATEILSSLPVGRRLFVPFYGGGGESHPAIESGLWERVALSDLNPHLVEAHQAARDEPDELVRYLLDFASRDPADQEIAYYLLRRTMPGTPTGRARRFCVLVGCAFNGLWRENRRGGFNVPFGRPLSVDEEQVRAVGELLRRPGVSLHCRDFGEALDPAGPGDVVYADPPYYPKSKTANFDAYCGKRFDAAEHRRLAADLAAADARGAAAFASNAAVPAALETYRGEVLRLEAPRRIAADPKKRVKVEEILVRIDHRRY